MSQPKNLKRTKNEKESPTNKKIKVIEVSSSDEEDLQTSNVIYYEKINFKEYMSNMYGEME